MCLNAGADVRMILGQSKDPDTCLDGSCDVVNAGAAVAAAADAAAERAAAAAPPRRRSRMQQQRSWQRVLQHRSRLTRMPFQQAVAGADAADGSSGEAGATLPPQPAASEDSVSEITPADDRPGEAGQVVAAGEEIGI